MRTTWTSRTNCGRHMVLIEIAESRKCQDDECVFYCRKVWDDRKGRGCRRGERRHRFWVREIVPILGECFLRLSVCGRNYFCQLSKHAIAELGKLAHCGSRSRLINDLLQSLKAAQQNPRRRHSLFLPAPPVQRIQSTLGVLVLCHSWWLMRCRRRNDDYVRRFRAFARLLLLTL